MRDQVEVVVHQGLERLAQHGSDDLRHLRDIHQGLEVVRVRQLDGGLGDVHGVVADTLHVGYHLHHRADGAKVARHGLLEGEQPHALLLDVQVHGVGGVVFRDDLARQLAVLVGERADGLLQHRLYEPAHLQEALLENLKLLVESLPCASHGRSRYPNRPRT